MSEIITDITKLGGSAELVDIRKEGELMRKTILDLKDTIREHNLSGLSAPQIGVDKRIVVINFNGDLRTFVNPIITDMKGLELAKETCSSIPGKTFIRPRNNQVAIAYQTPLGKVESRKLMGLAAIVFQHELDHLDGILLPDIGLEIDETFENATEEERQEVIDAYLESLDIKHKEINEEIENNPELKQMSDAIDFMTKVATGEVKVEDKKIEVKRDE